MSNYDTWKTRSPDDELDEGLPFPEDEHPEGLPCNWEKMSGVCMVCGAGPDDNCGYEDEHPVIRAANSIIAEQNRVLAQVHAALREIEIVCTESASDCRKRMGTRTGNTIVIARAALAKATNPVTTAVASGRAPTMEEVADVVGKGGRS